ncbi:MAG: hypothetical protein H6936_17325 [Burkholderiales bacterium]|nr:hypothetical protein [Nitrosomonas sp.]MCP5276572.1 hypothetical protein [Burkholderiales bacterium]
MTVSNEINLGNILTICSIVPGFFWWLYTNQRQLKRQKMKDAESGSLRVILGILRELNGKPIKITELKQKYNSPQLASTRKAYCGFDFYLHDINEFEKSVYALDWEGKIDFVGTQHIKFRFDTTEEQLKIEEQRLAEEKARRELEQLRMSQDEKRMSAIYEATPKDIKIALDSLSSAISNKDINDWEVEKIAKTAMLMNKQEATIIVRSALNSENSIIKNRALAIIGRLMSQY